jgi:Meiotically up-regulated gene 113
VGKIKDRKGLTYGKLTVVEFSHIANTSGRNAYWKCVCDCGNETTVGSQHLGKGTNSCGCLAKELSSKRIKKIHNTGQHLYFIACGEFMKIGRANNVEQRLSQLKAANPYPVTLINVMENEGYREKEFHKLFEKQHHSGEWFRLDIG